MLSNLTGLHLLLINRILKSAPTKATAKMNKMGCVGAYKCRIMDNNVAIIE